jgi:hypothetical protein
MFTNEYYRLEYNEKLGEFSYESFTKRKEGKFGWEIISMVISKNELQQFIEKVIGKYPSVNSGSGLSYPKYNEVKKMFNDFIGISDL